MKLERCKKQYTTIMKNYRDVKTEIIQKVICYNCNSTTLLSEAYADLDGEAFRSYYCRDCKNDIESAVLDEQNELLRKGEE